MYILGELGSGGITCSNPSREDEGRRGCMYGARCAIIIVILVGRLWCCREYQKEGEAKGTTLVQGNEGR